ncbi:MAG: response regulator [Anaerolineales bacterium]|jgi:CheY-like chemotaxis protein|nr:response regulator [Anaerolineales bacterium]
MAIKVLLVEDNQDNQDLMRFLLERNGYIVVTALNGKLALAAARREQPDVVLMDLTMPEMNGWEAAAAMKADPALAHIPLIAVTAHTLPGDRRKTLGAGFDNYISKPINVKMFDHVVAQVLEKRENETNS